MAEKTAIEILTEFAHRTNREVQTNEEDMSFFTNHTHTRHARTIWFPDKPGEKRYFGAFSNPRLVGIRSFYSGVFIPIDVPQKAIANIRKKTIFDKLKLPNLRKTGKFNNKKLDRRLMISGDQIDKTIKIIGDPKIQLKIYDFMKKNPVYRVVINDFDMSYIPELKSTSYLGLVRAYWELDPEKIEYLFNEINQFEKQL
ncbi:hypothetical protein [Salinivirga cyanobacteriivorans]